MDNLMCCVKYSHYLRVNAAIACNCGSHITQLNKMSRGSLKILGYTLRIDIYFYPLSFSLGKKINK